MKKIYTLIVLFLLITSSVISNSEETIVFTSSNLPILVINTNEQTIVDDPKITAHMGIIDNGTGNINYLTDAYNGYDGYIGIEIRGYSSSGWSDKKPYGFETRDSLGENNNVSLLGLPVENDWVLHAPQADKTLIRNKFVYDIAQEMGQYAPGSKFCELVIDGDYRGVYVLIEKIKRDKYRVDLEKCDSLNITGGYLVEMTPEKRVEADETSFTTEETVASIVVKYPDEESITTEQINYISDYFDDFETVLFSNNLSDTVTGYSKYIDVPSFVDHILLSECFHQLDGFYASQYFHKKQNGKLFMGPVWDYNRSCGNVEYYNIYDYDMWWMLDSRGDKRIPYANQLMSDTTFMKMYADRWFELRDGILNIDSINTRIDNYTHLLSAAKDRNYERWDEMLETNFKQVYVYNTYEAYVTQMKDWVGNKFVWLDEALQEYSVDIEDAVSIPQDALDNMEIKSYPNPFVESVSIELLQIENTQTSINVYSIDGKLLSQIHNGPLNRGVHEFTWDGNGMNGNKIGNGMYFCRYVSNGKLKTIKMVKRN